MSKVIYYVAMSIDGYIADHEGGVAWLEALPTEGDLGYEAFFSGVGAVVMGAKTYEQLLTFGPYPYPGVESVVVSSRDLPQPEGGAVRVVAGDIAAIVRDLRATHEKAIWVVGGAALAASLIDADLIDELDIMLMPALLRAGVPLLAPREGGSSLRPLTLIEQRTLPGGFVRLRYEVGR